MLLIAQLPAGAKKYIKKPIPIKAVQVHEPFRIHTLEGVMEGKAGDYVLQGAKGELYCCARDIFEDTYHCIE